MTPTRARALLLVALLAPLVPAAGAPTDAERVERALAWVATQQGADGAWSLTSQGYLLEAAASSGLDPKQWPTPQRSAFAAQPIEACGHLALPADRQDCQYKSLLRVVEAVGASGYDPADVNGISAVEQVRAGFVAGQFGQPQYVNDDVWAILALRAAGVPASDPQVRAAAQNVRDAQLDDGGWSHTALGGRSGIEMTGFALAALAAAGEDVRANAAARAYVERAYDATTGAYRNPLGDHNAQTTVWGIHAAALLGIPQPKALDRLRSLQTTSGGFSISGGDAPDLFATVEIVPVLAGARFPLPAYAPGAVDASATVAGEPATLRARGPFTRATWTLPDGTHLGLDATWTPTRAGAYPFALVAESPAARWRTTGTLVVGTRPPALSLAATEAEAYRGEPVTVDATGSTDADGRVAQVEVDWGDGNATRAPLAVVQHAYATPGERTARVRVMDDAGAWSATGSVAVRVLNRAPLLLDLPARVVADRVTDVRLAARAWDPEDDDVKVTWRAGDLAGEGNATARFAALGENVVRFLAVDAHGATAAAEVVVDVRNLPPALESVEVPATARPNEPFHVAARATDADGPAPRVTWRIGNATLDGAAGDIILPAGAHNVTVEAVDADGAVARESRVLLVAADDAPAQAQPPAIARFDARLADGALLVSVDATGDLVLSWESDAGNGSLALVGPGERSVPLAGATRATVRLVAERDGMRASREATVLAAPAPDELPPPVFDAPPATARLGLPARFVLLPMPDVTEYRFEFGDGAETAWTGEPTAAHAYVANGSFVVVAHARAKDGRTSSAATLLRVESPVLRAPRAVANETREEPVVEPAPVEAHALTVPDAHREAPLPWALALAGLLLAARGRRARRD